MPPKTAVLIAVLSSSIPVAASAAPRYIASRARPYSVASFRASRGAPAPAPGVAAPAPDPRLARIVARSYRTEAAAPPPQLAPARSIDAQALGSLSSGFESGGGFMPIGWGKSGVTPRTDN